MPSKKPKLKPCPFCGGTVRCGEFYEAVPYEPNTYYMGESISCDRCGAEIKEYSHEYEGKTYWRESEKQKIEWIRYGLIDFWNRRVKK